ncbi:uncharacterized protein PGTG_09606 [Puccinia graminis f. sp. tritici CRL 75-36-700-3]|uniref:Uncharacterized protein n=1 Tax=Puccinia graminis f. sp. tritici (strain CRL 75-36-700-3 / race SCCL) TaxID=418459 RepID=E3KHW8_PUCGT|nr:uncharacterized protein PGTG_09606 [Puccinia graminis f. sp. tritici CRL 75-36-700-3]EFP83893.2 hypothetical protein PGTG_09606 [Puccinia graminis f. sp. tritici CRL 75-36-700-3]
MKSFFCRSCYARLGRWLIISQLVLLFLSKANHTSANGVFRDLDIAAGVGDGLKGADLDKGKIDRVPQEKNPLLESAADTKAPHTPPVASPKIEVAPHAQATEPEKKKKGFWSMLVRFWKWMTRSRKPEHPLGKIFVASEPKKPWPSRFWTWFTEDRTYRDKPGFTLPSMTELREPFKGPWDRWTNMKYNPRTPTNTGERLLVSMRVLGDKLRRDPQETREFWEDELVKAGASPLRRKILSTDLFFELVTNLSIQEELGELYQKAIMEIGEEGNRMYKGHAYFKEELRRIMKNYLPPRPGKPAGTHRNLQELLPPRTGRPVGTHWDPDFYRKPLSPLLLLIERPELSDMAKHAPTYREAVNLHEKLKETVAAIKDYVSESDKLVITHENYEDDVMNYFRHLDRVKDRTFMTDIIRTGLTDEELQAIKTKALSALNPKRRDG